MIKIILICGLILVIVGAILWIFLCRNSGRLSRLEESEKYPTVDENSKIGIPHDDEIIWDAHDRIPQRITEFGGGRTIKGFVISLAVCVFVPLFYIFGIYVGWW